MAIILVGLNHKTAPVEIRERFAISENELGEALYRLKSNPILEEGAILSTCNRVEVYAVVKESGEGFEAVKTFFTQYRPDIEPDVLVSTLYFHAPPDSLRHFFRVASSLDSMILGEPQILGQVKDAFDGALRHKSTGLVLNRAFKKAISVAKRVRTETKVAENAVSISYAAVALAKKIFGGLTGKRVLLIGAGEMAELAARHFVSQGVETIFIANRNQDRAIELAREFNGVPVRFEDYLFEMAESDIVLCSTGAPHYLIGTEAVAKVIAARENRPIFFIDISVPRNIDPGINRLDNVFLYDIDDLKLSVEANLRSRETEALKAEEIISEEVERFSQWLKSLDAVPMIVALKDRAEEIRRAEIKKITVQLATLTEQQRAVIEALTLSLVNKLLHVPVTALKDEANSQNGTLVLESARKIFRLDTLLAAPEKTNPTEASPVRINPADQP